MYSLRLRTCTFADGLYMWSAGQGVLIDGPRTDIEPCRTGLSVSAHCGGRVRARPVTAVLGAPTLWSPAGRDCSCSCTDYDMSRCGLRCGTAVSVRARVDRGHSSPVDVQVEAIPRAAVRQHHAD